MTMAMSTAVRKKGMVEDSAMTEGLKIISRKKNAVAETAKLRVAAYCRVSTELEIQESSIELQMEAFEKTISEHPEWEIVEIYSDRGKTGTMVKGRSGFLRMIEDAKAGKIDLILTKSVSRVARNTRDMLEYTRMMRDIGVGFYFDEENINTLSMTSELLLTVYAAFNQEESHEISESLKTAIRNRFKLGIPMKTKAYGYSVDKEGNWEIVPEEAQVVRLIFSMLMDGYTPTQVADYLNHESIPTRSGKVKEWTCSTILSMVKNEKYIGDVLMQKSYTVDHLNHRSQTNNDLLVPQYYLKDHHEAIISREDHHEVQRILQLRDSKRGYVQFPYSGYLVCPFCGAPMVSCRLHSAKSPKVWVCSGHGEVERQGDRSSCPPYMVFESVIDKALVEAIRKIPVAKQDWRMQEKLTAIRKELKESDGRIMFSYLRLLVESITFPTWNEMEVTWKDGTKTTVPIEYESAFFHPYPEVGEIIKGKLQFGGFLLERKSATSSFRGLEARQRFIGNLLIRMPEPEEEFQIPYVKDGEKSENK